MCRRLRGVPHGGYILCDCLSGANDGGGLYAKISGNDISSDNDISNSSLSLAAVTATNNTAGKTLSFFVQSIVR